jgi:hypothetical protein
VCGRWCRIGCRDLDVCNSVMNHGQQQAKRATWAMMVLCGLSIWRLHRYEIDYLKCQESFRSVWTSFSFSVCNNAWHLWGRSWISPAIEF